jgi:hypothetical protein
MGGIWGRDHDDDAVCRSAGYAECSAGTEKWILYANMTIGETQLMGSDVPPERFQPPRSVYISLAIDNSEEANAYSNC